ncbi:MAG: 50S ribosomal protein L15 [Candidatus Binatia bacterium]
MELSDLRPAPGSKKRKKRVGRGDGSGHGKTSCRGHKGQGARAGGGTRPGFEGGQMPLVRRVPKRGFHNPFGERYALVNLGQLESFDSGSEVTPEILRSRGMVRQRKPVKVLADGNLSKALVVKAHRFSAKAKEKIEALGGTAELLP